MSEAASAQTVESVRREASAALQDADGKHQASIAEHQSRLDEAGAALAAKDVTIAVGSRGMKDE